MVNGDLDKYYPVTFFDGGWADNVATELEIGRSFLHLDGNVRGAMIAKFRFHVTNWGHGSEFIDADIRQYTNVNNKLIGGWQDGTLHNGSYTIIIWLRGNTSYFYRSNYAVNPKVYDGVQNALPYQEVNGPAHSYKASIDPYVNSIGMSYSNTAYFNGSGVNYYAGSLGIGTTTPGAYKLAVKGTIGAQKVKVTQSGWADFVFHPDYQLPSLYEIEKYIKAHRHLPDIPAAAEVEKEGLDLGEMDRRLLQKIEEQTLYLIELSKRIDTLQHKNARLQEQLSTLSNMLKK